MEESPTNYIEARDTTTEDVLDALKLFISLTLQKKHDIEAVDDTQSEFINAQEPRSKIISISYLAHYHRRCSLRE